MFLFLFELMFLVCVEVLVPVGVAVEPDVLVGVCV